MQHPMSDWKIGGYLALYTGVLILFWELLVYLASSIRICWS